MDDDGKVHFSVVNIDAQKTQEVTLDVSEMELTKVTGEILTSYKLQDHNTFDDPNKVQAREFKDVQLNNGQLNFRLPPFSVVVLEASK